MGKVTEEATVIRARFDGKVLVPDEPLDLPIGEPLKLLLERSEQEDQRSYEELTVEERLERLKRITGTIQRVLIPDEALLRENLYDERL
jgi:predicted DNA-binding antitoxin AbrB/MazE fold protein